MLHSAQNKTLILGFVTDLMFVTRIDYAVKHLGYSIKWIEEEIATYEQIIVPPESPGELLDGPAGQLFGRIAVWQPALFLFDLNDEFPWRQWIPLFKRSPATRHIPIMCFGSHMDVKKMTDAKRFGADIVLARSRFTADLPVLLEKYRRKPDRTGIDTACKEALSDLAIRGIGLFNNGEYYKCHDDLEMAWRQDKSAGGDLYQGILQFGIALYQIQRGNYRGAVKMLLRIRKWLTPLPEHCRRINISKLQANISEVYETVVALGPDRMDNFDWQQIEQILIE